MNFLRPTKKKLIIFFGLVLFVVAWIWVFFRINESEIASILLVPFLFVPYEIFNAVTLSYFSSACDGLIWCFPTLPEVGFVVVFDLVVLYLISCVIATLTTRKKLG